MRRGRPKTTNREFAAPLRRGGDLTYMKMQRRDFLRAGLLAAGGAAAGAVGGNLLAEDTRKAGHLPETSTLSISADGELVVTPSKAHASLPPTPAEVRRGIPGRRWVMVI